MARLLTCSRLWHGRNHGYFVGLCLFVCACVFFFLRFFFSAKIYPLLLKYKYLSVVEMEWSIFDESQSSCFKLILTWPSVMCADLSTCVTFYSLHLTTNAINSILSEAAFHARTNIITRSLSFYFMTIPVTDLACVSFPPDIFKSLTSEIQAQRMNYEFLSSGYIITKQWLQTVKYWIRCLHAAFDADIWPCGFKIR